MVQQPRRDPEQRPSPEALLETARRGKAPAFFGLIHGRQPAVEARAGSDGHQGVCAEVDPYTYAGAVELLALDSPLLVALDEVTDPQNLGAIARTAECAGAAGMIVPIPRPRIISGGRTFAAYVLPSPRRVR